MRHVLTGIAIALIFVFGTLLTLSSIKMFNYRSSLASEHKVSDALRAEIVRVSGELEQVNSRLETSEKETSRLNFELNNVTEELNRVLANINNVTDELTARHYRKEPICYTNTTISGKGYYSMSYTGCFYRNWLALEQVYTELDNFTLSKQHYIPLISNDVDTLKKAMDFQGFYEVLYFHEEIRDVRGSIIIETTEGTKPEWFR